VANGELIDEDLWRAMVLWLPPEPKDVRGGPPRVSNRAALAIASAEFGRARTWPARPLQSGSASPWAKCRGREHLSR
jgi:hypothetical protein